MSTRTQPRHTPGPWTVHRGDNSYISVRREGPLPEGARYRVCGVGTGRHNDQEDLANAQLIAAAPLLLRRLTEARDAIASLPARALGMGGGNGPTRWSIQRELLAKVDAAIKEATP